MIPFKLPEGSGSPGLSQAEQLAAGSTPAHPAPCAARPGEGSHPKRLGPASDVPGRTGNQLGGHQKP